MAALDLVLVSRRCGKQMLSQRKLRFRFVGGFRMLFVPLLWTLARALSRCCAKPDAWPVALARPVDPIRYVGIIALYLNQEFVVSATPDIDVRVGIFTQHIVEDRM